MQIVRAHILRSLFLAFVAFVYGTPSYAENAGDIAVFEKGRLTFLIRDAVYDSKLELARLVIEVREGSRERSIAFSSFGVSPPTFIDASRKRFGSIESVPPICQNHVAYRCQFIKTTTDETVLLTAEFDAIGFDPDGKGMVSFSVISERQGLKPDIMTFTSPPFPIIVK